MNISSACCVFISAPSSTYFCQLVDANRNEINSIV